jgi:hypothetical protein
MVEGAGEGGKMTAEGSQQTTIEGVCN